MSRIIDLSTPISENHFRWNVDRKLKKSHETGDKIQSTWAGWSMHGFSHVDTPRHFDPKGFTTDNVSVDMVTGQAAVVDISTIEPKTEVTADMVAAAGKHIREGDIILLRSGWDRRESIDKVEFWTKAPYMSRQASEWLLNRKIKGIAFDFPQDYCIRHYVLGDREPEWEENITHTVLLLNGVLMFEYLCNMMEIREKRVFFIGLPMKIANSDGAPVRAIAIEQYEGLFSQEA